MSRDAVPVELDVTSRRVNRVCWAIGWRAGIAFLLMLSLLLPAVGFLAQRLGLSGVWVDRIIRIVGVLVSVEIYIWSIRWVLGRKLGDFRLVLASPLPAAEEAHHDTVP